jgi:hypothetical protein
MIQIDFQGGAHGNFLEFICNTLCGITDDQMPFNSAGASHSKKYIGKKTFFSDHYSFEKKELGEKVISIQIAEDDLLPLSQISLLRAGDYGYDNDYLEIDTYNKLNNDNYRWVLDNIIDSFFKGQIQSSYNNVKDVSWPDIHTLDDFARLPEHIYNECINVHNLELLELNKNHPDCPRHVLREFLQLGFENPSQHGFISQQRTMINYGDRQVYIFPFCCFYDTDLFLDQIKQIALWAEIQYTQYDNIVKIHSEFLKRQPYKHSKIKCDAIVQDIIANRPTGSAGDLLEEAYINAQLKKHNHECRY